MIRHGPETCILGVIVNGGQSAASPEQIAALEQHIGPVLAKRGLRISHDKDDADLLARVELTVDAANPRHLTYSIRGLEPNPFLPGPRQRPVDGLERANAAIHSELRRDEGEFSISK
jgi:hypothetical protein